jgi:hypothetical protein
LCKAGPRSETETIFEELQDAYEKPPPREIKANRWISNATWTLIDNRAMARKRGMLTQQSTRRWGRQIKASLNSDRIKRAANVATDIEAHLAAGDLKEAWRCLKGWYTAASDRLPKPCHASMDKQTAEIVELYRKVPPPGDPIPINVEPFDLDDSIPEDAAIREVVAGLKMAELGEVAGYEQNTLSHGFET